MHLQFATSLHAARRVSSRQCHPVRRANSAGLGPKEKHVWDCRAPLRRRLEVVASKPGGAKIQTSVLPQLPSPESAQRVARLYGV